MADPALKFPPGVDPVLWSLANAPDDDEPETESERAAVAEALAETESVTSDELRKLLGL